MEDTDFEREKKGKIEGVTEEVIRAKEEENLKKENLLHRVRCRGQAEERSVSSH